MLRRRRGEFVGCKLGGERVARAANPDAAAAADGHAVCCGVRANLMQLRSPRTVRRSPEWPGEEGGLGVGRGSRVATLCLLAMQTC